MIKKHKDFIYEGMLILVAIIWGSGFIAAKLAVNLGASPLTILVLRFFVASLFLTIIFWKSIGRIKKKDLFGGMLTGFFLYSAFAFQTYGIKYTTPSNNAFLTATNVVIVPFIYWVFYKKRPKNKAFLAAVLCLLGIGLLTLKDEFGMNIGDIYTLICAVLFAGHIVCNDYFIHRMPSLKLVALQMYFAFLFSGLMIMVMENPMHTSFQLDGKAILFILYLGIVSTGVAFLLQTIAQKKVNANKTVIFLSLESVFGTFFSIIIFHEIIHIQLILGAVLVLIAIMIAEYEPRSKVDNKEA